MARTCLILLVLCVVFGACSPGYLRFKGNYQALEFVQEPNYASLDCWAAHPDKYDPSDSIPLPLRGDYHFDSSVDVFFLYPTSFTTAGASEWNAALGDAALNAKTDYSSILFQASVFNEYRVFAPRYRQAHIRSFFTEDSVAAAAALEKAYQDIRTAFQYYLDHENRGRPIILASHSQGTTHAIRLLRDFFDGQALLKQLVAAYITGMYTPKESFSDIALCTAPEQTHCFCSWRTFRTNYVPDYVLLEPAPSAVVNPLNWTTDTRLVPRAANSGAILRKFNKRYLGVADAKIENGILWTHRPRFPGGLLVRSRNYHIGDINLYYYSIRNNLRRRVKSFTP